MFIYAPLLEQKALLRNIFALKQLRNNHDAMFYRITTDNMKHRPSYHGVSCDARTAGWGWQMAGNVWQVQLNRPATVLCR
jgi:hypothetical protein